MKGPTVTMRSEVGSTAEGGKSIAETRAQVNEVVDIMRVNIDKVLERDQNLSELDRRADELQVGARQFEQQTGRLKRQYWLQNLKMILIIIAIAVVVLIIIIVWATSGSGSYTPPPTSAPTLAPESPAS